MPSSAAAGKDEFFYHLVYDTLLVLLQTFGKENHDTLVEEIELLDGASDEFDLERVQAGELCPVKTNFFTTLYMIRF